MKILVLSDLHANNKILDDMNDLFATADAVVFAGDFAECFKPETGKAALEALCSKHDTIYAVLGNCDEPDFINELEDKDIAVENTIIYSQGLAFAGSGGGSYFTGKTVNERSEEELLSDFDIVENSIKDSGDSSLWKNMILISHNPPKDTKCDKVNDSLHAGSIKFSELIKEKQPLAVITGHIHEGFSVDKIGDTVLMNPGALAEGRYGILEVNDGKVTKAEIHNLSE